MKGEVAIDDEILVIEQESGVENEKEDCHRRHAKNVSVSHWAMS